MVLLKVLPDRLRPDRTPGSERRPAPGTVPETGRGVRATWRYTVVSIAVYCVFVSLVSTLLMLDGGEYGLQLLDIVIIALALASTVALVRYCWFFRSGLGRGLPERRYTLWLLVPGAGLWFLGLAQPHSVWVGALPLWFACNALCVVVDRSRRWWVMGAGFVVLLVHGPLGILLGHALGGRFWEAGGAVSMAFYALLTPAIFLASIWFWDIVLRLDDSRRTSGELAVAKERLRFAADLHDIQGHHLQVIALKAELAARLLDVDPEAARSQITEAQDLARTALEDTRALVHGYRTVTLAAEAANAAEVLRAAGIACSVEVDADGLAPEERTLFGLVIREATTNILRHSEAASVKLRLARIGGRSVLTVRNDGAHGDAEARPGGSGIDGLRRRFEAVGGGVRAERKGSDFVLTATAPEPSSPARAGHGDVATGAGAAGSTGPVEATEPAAAGAARGGTVTVPSGEPARSADFRTGHL